MAQEQKYTLWESFWIFVVAGAVIGPITAFLTIVFFPVAMLTAWIRWLLWQWFLTPYLHVPMIPYWAMLGIGLFTSTWSTSDQPTGYKPTTEDNINRFIAVILVQLMALAVGYVVHRYIH